MSLVVKSIFVVLSVTVPAPVMEVGSGLDICWTVYGPGRGLHCFT